MFLHHPDESFFEKMPRTFKATPGRQFAKTVLKELDVVLRSNAVISQKRGVTETPLIEAELIRIPFGEYTIFDLSGIPGVDLLRRAEQDRGLRGAP